METMYRGITNSPKTELVALIAETDTEIEVADSSVLLANEGIAVIGNGDVAETIKYTEVDGNVLKGCIRGYEGIARTWTAGTRVARNFTAGDWNTAIDNIEGLYDRLDDAETVDVTLQPGLQVISAAKDARFRLGEIRGKTEINGQGLIGLIGVENPYVIATSGNMLPPFYEWNNATEGNLKFISAYEAQITRMSSAGNTWYVTTNPEKLVGASYVLSVYIEASINSGSGAYVQLLYFDAEGNRMTEADQTEFTLSSKQVTLKSNIPANAVSIQAAVGIAGTSVGTATFKKPMLTLGTEPQPFQPQHKSMLAFQTELHADPEDGSDPDVLFEQDGRYEKLAKWKKLLITGDYGFALNRTQAGYKSIRVSLGIYSNMVNGDLRSVGTMTKYDGTLITKGTYLAGADKFDWDSNNGYVLITVANTDSGWGDNYTQVDEGEIKAYFNGWKMYRAEDGDGNISTSIYNGTGTKKWARRSTASAGWEGGTVSLPTTQAPTDEVWSPYNLQYRLAKETVEPVVTEGCLALSEGDNVVEVGTGIVLRERVTPFFVSDGNYYINKWDAAPSHLKYKTEKIVQIYNVNKADFGWTIQNTPDDTAGNMQRALINASRYDQSAAYSVTYLKLDKSPIVPISGNLAANEKAQLSDLTAGVSEALQRTSVLEQKKAEKDAVPPQWITPTLLNTFTPYSGFFPPSYYKSDGIVRLQGLIRVGSVFAAGTVLFNLPLGYRPAGLILLIALGGNSSYVRLNVSTTGDVSLQTTLTEGGGFISLSGLTFRTEQ